MPLIPQWAVGGTVTPQLPQMQPLRVEQATPDAFGAAQGQALQGMGAATQHAGDKLFDAEQQRQQVQNQITVNDLQGSQFGPQAAAIVGQYRATSGRDAVEGRGPALQGLGQLRDRVLGSTQNLQVRAMLGEAIRRQMSMDEQLIEGHAAEQHKVFDNQTTEGVISTLTASAVQDPARANTVLDSINTAWDQYGQRNGSSPEWIAAKKQASAGTTAELMVRTALGNGQFEQARGLLGRYHDLISGPALAEITGQLQHQSTLADGEAAADAIMHGRPVPAAAGPGDSGDWAAVGRVRSVAVPEARRGAYQGEVRANAERTGVPEALLHAVIGAESSGNPAAVGPVTSYGWRAKGLMQLSPRPGLASDADYFDVAKNISAGTDELAADLKKYRSIPVALAAYNWGPAKVDRWLAAGADPAKLPAETRDYIASITSNPEVAQLMRGSGGAGAAGTAAASSAGAHPSAVALSPAAVPLQAAGTPDAGEAGRPREGAAPAANPAGGAWEGATNPRARLMAIDAAYPGWVASARAIPGQMQREAALTALKRQRDLAAADSAAWVTQTSDKLLKLGVDPSFTAMTQVPPDLLPALSDNPRLGEWLEKRAEANARGDRPDNASYGPGFVDLYGRIHAAVGDPKRLTDPNALYPLVASGQLTVAGVDKLKAEIAGRHTVDGERLSEYRRQLLTAANDEINGLHDAFKLPYPKGKENLQAFTIAADQYIDQQRAAGKPLGDIFNPQTKGSVYSLLPQFVPSLSERLSSLNQPTPAATTGTTPPPNLSGLRSLDDFRAAVARGTITRDQAAAEALRRGMVRPDPVTPSVPVR